jgi:hypothetical protein
MCNYLHKTSAKCTSDLTYDVFGDGEVDATECSYIESLRFGTYDSDGQLKYSFGATDYEAEVTSVQRGLLGGSVGLCCLLILYACYLHHAMTNLLIKSLSHRELLPPSRHHRRSPSAPRRVSSRRLNKVADNPDWDEHAVEDKSIS